MQRDRRKFLAGSAALGGLVASRTPGALAARATAVTGRARPGGGRAGAEARAASTSPVIIDSIRLLKKGDEYFVHVRSKDGAEGISLANPPRAEYLDKILKQLVIPFFIGKDARDLEELLWELYRCAGQLQAVRPRPVVPAGLGGVRHPGHAGADRAASRWGRCWATSCARTWPSTWPAASATPRPSRRSSTCRSWSQQSGARAVKFRVGGRMSRNADAMPGRTEKLIPLVRKTLGDAIDIHADSNSSYDAAARHQGRPHAGGGQGGLLRGAVPVRPPGGDQGGGGRADHPGGRRRAGVQRLALPLDDRQPRRRHRAARPALLRRDDPLDARGAHGRSWRRCRPPCTSRAASASCTCCTSPRACPTSAATRSTSWAPRSTAAGSTRRIRVKDGKMTVPTGPGVGIKDVRGVLAGAVEV